MKMKIMKTYIIFFVIVAFIVIIVNIIREVNYNTLIKRDIKNSYSALVIEKFNPKEWTNIATQLRLKNINGNIDEIVLRSEIMDFISVGDSLFKIKCENLCYVKKPSGEVQEFYYVRIPKANRNHWTFPKEWKNKWMESSVWDTLERK